MIKTKSVYDPAEASDGERILISRYRPRGLSKERLAISAWIRDLAPSKERVNDWKSGSTDWVEYQKRYKAEMAVQTEQIKILAEKSSRGTITLLCFEKEHDTHCHRHLLKKMMEGGG